MIYFALVHFLARRFYCCENGLIIYLQETCTLCVLALSLGIGLNYRAFASCLVWFMFFEKVALSDYKPLKAKVESTIRITEKFLDADKHFP